MPPRVRTLGLTAHVASSVGWLGAVVCSLGLAVAGLTSQDDRTVRAAYLALELTGRYVLLPFALASLLTGLLQSFGSSWGLFRHYWVLAKLLITVFATVVLMLHMESLGDLAAIAGDATAAGGDLGGLRSGSPVLHAGAAVLLLVTATALGVYKPRGLTPYGQRKQRERRTALRE